MIKFNRQTKTSTMKLKLIFGLLLSIMFLPLASCDSDKNGPNIEGKWDDNIKLSQKTANFSSESNSVTITSEYDGWWLNGIALNKVGVDLSNINKISKDFVVTNSEFQVERKDGKTIIITMNKNATNAERVLSISLQNGDFFNSINVVQAK